MVSVILLMAGMRYWLLMQMTKLVTRYYLLLGNSGSHIALSHMCATSLMDCLQKNFFCGGSWSVSDSRVRSVWRTPA